jgi:hypothetical protein
MTRSAGAMRGGSAPVGTKRALLLLDSGRGASALEAGAIGVASVELSRPVGRGLTRATDLLLRAPARLFQAALGRSSRPLRTAAGDRSPGSQNCRRSALKEPGEAGLYAPLGTPALLVGATRFGVGEDIFRIEVAEGKATPKSPALADGGSPSSLEIAPCQHSPTLQTTLKPSPPR